MYSPIYMAKMLCKKTRGRGVYYFYTVYYIEILEEVLLFVWLVHVHNTDNYGMSPKPRAESVNKYGEYESMTPTVKHTSGFRCFFIKNNVFNQLFDKNE